MRRGNWKLLLPDRQKFYGYVKDRGTSGVELYDLDADIGESRNVAREQPDVVNDLLAHVQAFTMPTEPYHTGIRLPQQNR